MTGITHRMTRDYLLDAADGLLDERHRLDLEQHLKTCAVCRAYAADLDRLSLMLNRR